MPELDEHLRIKEAAENLRVARNAPRNRWAAGRIPAHRHPLNNYRLFKASDLDKLLRKTEQSVAKRSRKPR